MLHHASHGVKRPCHFEQIFNETLAFALKLGHLQMQNRLCAILYIYIYNIIQYSAFSNKKKKHSAPKQMNFRNMFSNICI